VSDSIGGALPVTRSARSPAQPYDGGWVTLRQLVGCANMLSAFTLNWTCRVADLMQEHVHRCISTHCSDMLTRHNFSGAPSSVPALLPSARAARTVSRCRWQW
jgi:hypothetical protein